MICQKFHNKLFVYERNYTFEIIIEILLFLSTLESTIFVFRFEQYEKKIFIADNTPKIETCTKLYVYHFPKYLDLASLTESEVLDLSFTDSLAHVNGFIDAARHRFGLVHIYNVTLWDLPQIIKIQMNGKEFPYFTNPELLSTNDFIIVGEDFQLISETEVLGIAIQIGVNHFIHVPCILL